MLYKFLFFHRTFSKDARDHISIYEGTVADLFLIVLTIEDRTLGATYGAYGGHRSYLIFYYLVDDECDVHFCRIDLLTCIDYFLVSANS